MVLIKNFSIKNLVLLLISLGAIAATAIAMTFDVAVISFGQDRAFPMLLIEENITGFDFIFGNSSATGWETSAFGALLCTLVLVALAAEVVLVVFALIVKKTELFKKVLSFVNLTALIAAISYTVAGMVITSGYTSVFNTDYSVQTAAFIPLFIVLLFTVSFAVCDKTFPDMIEEVEKEEAATEAT